MNSFSFFFLVNNKNALTFVFLNPLRRWYIPLVFRLVNSISLQSIYTEKKTAGVLVQKRPIISFIILLFIIYLCVCVCMNCNFMSAPSSLLFLYFTCVLLTKTERDEKRL
jgi:hypothetical protein